MLPMKYPDLKIVLFALFPGVLNTNSTNEEMRSVVHLSGESLFNMISTALNSLLRMGMEDEIRPGDVLYGLSKIN